MKPLYAAGESLTITDLGRCYLHKQGRTVGVGLRAASAEMTMRLEFKILRGVTKMNRRITTLVFWRADFDLFRDLLGRIPSGGALKGKGAQENWLIKDSLWEHRDGLLSCAESWGSMAESHFGWIWWFWLSPSTKRKCTETEAGAGYLGGCRDVACLCEDGVRKAKAHLELNLAR